MIRARIALLLRRLAHRLDPAHEHGARYALMRIRRAAAACRAADREDWERLDAIDRLALELLAQLGPTAVQPAVAVPHNQTNKGRHDDRMV